jgi:hypothetical protein
MSDKGGRVRRTTRAASKQPTATGRRVTGGWKWLVLAAAGLALAGALFAAMAIGQPPKSQILAQKCSRCHQVQKLTGLNLDAASATAAVDKMTAADRVTLTPQERDAAIGALSGK